MTYFNSSLKAAKLFKATKLGLIASLCIGMSACATSGANVIPVIDAPNSPKLQADLAQCQTLAAQYNGSGNDTALAAAVGAGLGALVGGTINNRFRRDSFSGNNALAGAAIGGAAGLGYGTLQGEDKKAEIVYRCMAGRGYKVLG